MWIVKIDGGPEELFPGRDAFRDECRARDREGDERENLTKLGSIVASAGEGKGFVDPRPDLRFVVGLERDFSGQLGKEPGPMR